MRDVVMRFLREFGNWRTAHDTGVWRYQENAATGRRRILRVSCDGYQPIDASWVEGQGGADADFDVWQKCNTLRRSNALAASTGVAKMSRKGGGGKKATPPAGLYPRPRSFHTSAIQKKAAWLTQR